MFQIHIACLCTSLSLGNLVLISIDHFVKITITRVMCCMSITWCCCIIYDAAIIKDIVNVQVPSRCLNECFTGDGYVG